MVDATIADVLGVPVAQRLRFATFSFALGERLAPPANLEVPLNPETLNPETLNP